MPAAARTAGVVVRRIEALRRDAQTTAQRCQHDWHRAEAHDVVATLDEAHAWLRAAGEPRPELVVHIAKMVEGANRRLCSVVARAR